MPGLLYFVPGRPFTAPELVRQHRLGYAFAADPLLRQVPGGGPDGEAGIVLVDRGRVPEHDIGYHASRQVWRRIPGGKAWVGHYLDAGQPGPDDLARPRQLRGHAVELGDGRKWLVPIARGYLPVDGELRWYCALPERSVYGEDGRWEPGPVVGQYQGLWDLATSWDDARRRALLAAVEQQDKPAGDAGEVQLEFDFHGLHSGAVEVLAFNYTLGPVECDLLGLLTEQLAADVLCALVDLPTRLEWISALEKKTAGQTGSDGVNLSGGPGTSTPAIVLPSPTCGP